MKNAKSQNSRTPMFDATAVVCARVTAVLFGISFALGAAQSNATTYTITETLATTATGGTANIIYDPVGLNQQGQIVGSYGSATILYDSVNSSFVNLTSLGVNNAVGINAAGQIAARAGTLGPVIRNADGTLIPLTAPAGHTVWWPTAINDNGYSVGMVRDTAIAATGDNVCSQRAVLWDPAGNAQLVGMLPAVRPWSYPRGLNRLGQVVGQSPVGEAICSPGAIAHAFVTTATGLKDLHYPALLPYTTGQSSAAYAINDLGIAVGQLQTSTFFYAPAGRAVVWNTVNDSFVVFGDGTRDSSLLGINNSGTVVGYEANRAVVGQATGGELVDLNTLIPGKPATLILSKAVAITESGQILTKGYDSASGTSGGGFLLTPIAASVVNAPTNLSALSSSATNIQLNWVDNANNESVQTVERCTGVGCSNFAQIALLNANITSYSDNNLSALTTYRYRVRAQGSSGDSAYSNIASATTLSAVSATVPASPTNLRGTASGSQVALNWTDNANNETNVLIERCKGAACSNFSQIASVGANVTSYSDTGLRRNSDYRYRVRASNAVGRSVYSNVLTIRTSP